MILGWNEKRLTALWQEVAEARGGTYHADSGEVPLKTVPALEVDHGETRLYMDLQVKSGNSTAWYTRVRARLAVPAGPKLKVVPPGKLSPIGRALGAQDVEVGGDAEFDEQFVVKCHDIEQLRRMWGPKSKQRMLRLRRPRVTCDREVLYLRLDEALEDRGQIDDALDLVGELASADLFGLALLRELAEADYHPPRGPWNLRTLPFAVVEGLVPITVGPVVNEKGAAHTRAEALGVAEGHRCRAAVGNDGAIMGDEALLPQPALSAIRRVGDADLTVGEGHAHLAWSGIVTDPQQLEAGAELVASFAAAPALGAFR